MTAFARIKSFFRGTKAKVKTEGPKPAAAEAKKEAPPAPEKKG